MLKSQITNTNLNQLICLSTMWLASQTNHARPQVYTSVCCFVVNSKSNNFLQFAKAKANFFAHICHSLATKPWQRPSFNALNRLFIHPSVFCYSVSQSSDNQASLSSSSRSLQHVLDLPHCLHPVGQYTSSMMHPSPIVELSHLPSFCVEEWQLYSTPLPQMSQRLSQTPEKACICDLFLSVITEKLVTIRDWVKSCPHVKQFICHTSVCLLTVGH